MPLQQSGLWHTDMNPAGIWVSNPLNLVRDNAVADSDGSGIFFDIVNKPKEGHISCWRCLPAVIPSLGFSGNTAHSNAQHGFAIGSYWPQAPYIVRFSDSAFWRNFEAGVSTVGVAVMRIVLERVVVADNRRVGVRIADASAGPWGSCALLDSLLVQSVDRIAFAERHKSQLSCKSAKPCVQLGVGLGLPASHRFVTRGVTFVNHSTFPSNDTSLGESVAGGAGRRTWRLAIQALTALGACGGGGCGAAGGWEARFSRLAFVNTSAKASLFDPWEVNWVDEDGTLSETGMPMTIVADQLPLPYAQTAAATNATGCSSVGGNAFSVAVPRAL